MPKLWYRVLRQAMQKLELHKSKHSYCLFERSGQNFVYILVYEDYLLLIGSCNAVGMVKEQLLFGFETTELEVCTYYIGNRVERRESGILLSQEVFARKNADIARKKNAKTPQASLPLLHALYQKLEAQTDDEWKYNDKIPHSSKLGFLLYLQLARDRILPQLFDVG